MNDRVILQTTNPAKDLYRYLYSIVQYQNPASLTPDEIGGGSNSSALALHDHVDLGSRGFYKGKPVMRIGHFMEIYANGDFWTSFTMPRSRYWKQERDLLARHTFIQWTYICGSGTAMFIQDHKRTPTAHHYTRRLYESDWHRRRPYLELLPAAPLFDNTVVYRLYQVGACDWKIKAVRTRKDNVSSRAQRIVVEAANKVLDERYTLAEARYQRAERKEEIESWRRQGVSRPPRSAVRREEVVRAFIDHSIVFEPKSTPQVQGILPFTSKEAMAHGR